MRRQFLAADARGEARPDPVNEAGLAALTRAVIRSHEAIVREQTAVIADLEAQSACYRTAIETVGQGVSFFGERRKINPLQPPLRGDL